MNLSTKIVLALALVFLLAAAAGALEAGSAVPFRGGIAPGLFLAAALAVSVAVVFRLRLAVRERLETPLESAASAYRGLCSPEADAERTAAAAAETRRAGLSRKRAAAARSARTAIKAARTAFERAVTGIALVRQTGGPANGDSGGQREELGGLAEIVDEITNLSRRTARALDIITGCVAQTQAISLNLSTANKEDALYAEAIKDLSTRATESAIDSVSRITSVLTRSERCSSRLRSLRSRLDLGTEAARDVDFAVERIGKALSEQDGEFKRIETHLDDMERLDVQEAGAEEGAAPDGLPPAGENVKSDIPPDRSNSENAPDMQ